MKTASSTKALMMGCVVLLGASCACAQDWPQWRGPNRDNKVTKFTPPKVWPKALTQKWKTEVGLGDASPVLAGDKVYVFTRQGDDEVILCLDAGSGKEVWRDKYAAVAVTRPAQSHPGPRSTPAVADGKVCTLGVGGVLSCLDADTGKVVWRKDTKAYPQFFTSASPIIVEGNCVAYLGGGRGKGGEITAFDLAKGEVKWKWTGEAPAYGSPVLMTVDGAKQIVTPTPRSVVGIGVGDGKLLWQFPFKSRYNSGTPVVEGQTVIYSGSPAGTVAIKVEKKDGGFAAKELWNKNQAASTYNTPVLKDGLLYGISAARKGKGSGNFFCMDAKTGDVLWTDKTGRGDCGSILDAGPVLLALTSVSEDNLVVFKPSNKGYEELAKYKVADTPPWTCPIVAGNRVFVKDRDSLILWTIE
jgi:outer membrane protein assembly factor BamB